MTCNHVCAHTIAGMHASVGRVHVCVLVRAQDAGLALLQDLFRAEEVACKLDCELCCGNIQVALADNTSDSRALRKKTGSGLSFEGCRVQFIDRGRILRVLVTTVSTRDFQRCSGTNVPTQVQREEIHMQIRL